MARCGQSEEGNKQGAGERLGRVGIGGKPALGPEKAPRRRGHLGRNLQQQPREEAKKER